MTTQNCSWHYWAYGLPLKSEVEIPAFLSFDESCCRTIPYSEWITIQLDPTLAATSVIPEDVTRQSIAIQVDGIDILLYIRQLGIFKIENGHSIRCCPSAHTRAEQLSLALSGVAMAALLFQRQCVVVHGSAVAMGGSAELILGDSGTGKSSLAIALQQRGYSVLTDDLVVIASYQGVPHVLPAFPQMRVTQDTAKALGLNWRSLLELPDRFKRGFRFESKFLTTAIPLEQIYILKPSEQASCIRSLPEPQKVMELMHHSQVMALFAQDRHSHFVSCAQLAQQVPVHYFYRPLSWLGLPATLDTFQKHWSTNSDQPFPA